MLKCFLLILLFTSFIGVCCELKVGVRDFPPYSSKDENGQWSGVDIKIFNTLFSDVDCKVKYIDIAFGHSLLLLKDGKIDVMSQLSKTIDRIKTIYFVGPSRLETLSLITTKEVTETITSFEIFTKLPYLFGKRSGTYIGKEFHFLYDNNEAFAKKFIPMTANNSRIDMVLKNRVVGFFDESLLNQYLLDNSEKYKNMKLHPLKILNGAVYIGLSKISIEEELYQKIKRSFKRLKQQGKL